MTHVNMSHPPSPTFEKSMEDKRGAQLARMKAARLFKPLPKGRTHSRSLASDAPIPMRVRCRRSRTRSAQSSPMRPTRSYLPERVFSILNDTFDDVQDHALADYIELSLDAAAAV